MPSMRILVVATKSPWPPRDGGRLALWSTMQGLAAAGHELTLIAAVAPADAADAPAMAVLRTICTPHLVAVSPRSWASAAWLALRERCALTVARHRFAAVEAEVARTVAAARPDVVHVEQLQALANCGAIDVPIVLRMQNVESSLWQQVARARWQALPLLAEARRLRADERHALRRADVVVALTEPDADALRAVAGVRGDHIDTVAPAFPATLPPGRAVRGTPAVALAGSGGWWPNRDGTGWFIDCVVPLLRRAAAGVEVHVFGGSARSAPAIAVHAAPDDAAEAFPHDAIAAVPLRIGSGIRMRILEAWARGLPVVATSVAAAGLAVQSGRELLIADTPSGFADAIARLHGDPELAAALRAGGRAYLLSRHDSVRVTAALVAKYADAQRRRPAQPPVRTGGGAG
jgi:hypothetical protein